MYCWLLCGIKFKWLVLNLELFFPKEQWPKTVIVRELETMTQETVEGTGNNYVEQSLGIKRDEGMIAP